MDPEYIGSKSNVFIGSEYVDVGINEEHPLYDGELLITTNIGTVSAEGNITCSIEGRPKIRFKAVIQNGLPTMFGKDECLISIPVFTESAKAYVELNSGTISTSGWEGSLAGIIAEPLELTHKRNDGKPESIGRIHFHLINFLDYEGEAVQVGHNSWPARATLSFDPWIVVLDSFPDPEDLRHKASILAANLFTHVGCLSRADGKLFQAHDEKHPDATGAMEFLFYLFSFFNGSYTGCQLPIGLRHKGYPLWKSISVNRLSTSRASNRWFCDEKPVECMVISEAFYRLWQDENDREWLKRAISLYVASNTGVDEIDLALTNSQICIELLSWVSICEENSVMSDEAFERLSAADKLRITLFLCGISHAVPPELTHLTSHANNVTDAPATVTEIRNRLIHQTKKHRSELKGITWDVIYEAWQLNMWYIELILLHLLKYEGTYHNRLKSPNGTEWVPWKKLK